MRGVNNGLRRTKIVCTIGPATSSPGMLDRLVAAGMDAARLNFSHGTHEEHGERARLLREPGSHFSRLLRTGMAEALA